MTTGRDQPPRKLDAAMFPTLPKRGTRLSGAERDRLDPKAHPELARSQRPPQRAPAAPAPAQGRHGPCGMCGQPSAKPKCGRCWGILSGLASLRREHPEAYEAFVATIR